MTLTTKRGKQNQVVIHNLVGLSADGCYLYSFVSTDGFNTQQRVKNKVKMYEQAAANASNKSYKYIGAANEAHEFLSLGEPIKIGHHSEKRHRALIARNHKRMDNAVVFDKKSQYYKERAEAWRSHEDDINLSMPESLDFFKNKLTKAEEYHAGLKSGKYQKEHSFTMAYANKAVKTLRRQVQLAVKLWG